MKKIFSVLFLGGFSLVVLTGFSGSLDFKTGDAALEAELNGIRLKASTKEGLEVVIKDIQVRFGVPKEEVKVVIERESDVGSGTEKGEGSLNAGDVYLMALLAKEANVPFSRVVELRKSKGRGWGRICKELGLHPSILGKAKSKKAHKKGKSKKAKKDKGKGKNN